MLKINLIANYFGQGWTVLMNLAFVPLYIKYLGIEAYGLIGIFAVLQSLLTLLDMGLTPILIREMGQYCGDRDKNEKIYDIFRTAEIVAGAISIFIAVTFLLSSNWIATIWIKSSTLSTNLVEDSIVIMGFVAALRFMESIYRSSIIGLQQQVRFNIVNAGFATLRALGAVVVLSMISATIHTFFLWQGFVSLLSLIILRYITKTSIPDIDLRGRFATYVLKDMWRFAAGVTGITVLGLLLTQIDKILLSKLLTLEDFGYFTLATLVSGSLFMLVGPITQAYYPKFCELYSKNDISRLTDEYHNAAKLVTVVVGSFAMVLILFSESILMLWTQNGTLAKKLASLVSVLAIGNFINCLMYIPYQIQLTYGWTKLALNTNIISVLILVPVILFVVPEYGAMGAAWIWTILNMGYATIGIQFMHRKIFTLEKWSWYKKDVIIPILYASSTVLLVKASSTVLLVKITEPSLENSIIQATTIIVALALTLCVSCLSINKIRQKILEKLKCRTLNF